MWSLQQAEAREVQQQVQVPLHGPEAFAGMRRAGRLAAEVLDMITPEVRVGVTTEELDRLCHEFITARGATPAPLGYRGYPKSICTSVNEVVCHGIPERRPLEDGDILNIDVTVILDGWYGDSSRMFFAGSPSIKAKHLCRVTFEALWKGIEEVRPGATLGDVSRAIQRYAEANHYAVVQDFCGHGIGRVFHDAPSVLHYYFDRDKKNRKKGKINIPPQQRLILQPGMIFTIEPMINVGTWKVKMPGEDGWTVVTGDGKLSAQFEHTVGVTADGVEVFTISPAGLHHPAW